MRKVRYIDTYCYKFMHEQFNTSLLLMLGYVFDCVECRASKSFNLTAKRVLDGKSTSPIEYKPIFIVSGTSRWASLTRYLVSAVLNCLFLVFTPSDRVIIFSYNNLFAVRALNFINKICHKRVIVFCHGEMELLSPYSMEAGQLRKVLSFLARNYFCNKKLRIADGLLFSVLGTSIKENLAKILPDDKMKHFVAVDHAYLFDTDILSKKDSMGAILHCGSVGVFSKPKGADQFLELAQKLKLNERKDIQFSITGVIDYNTVLLNKAAIDLPQNIGRGLLDREEFNHRIDKLDFILFLYPRSSYRLMASGAVLDAINREKPIIALRNDYFEYLFRKYGEFGFLADNLGDIAELLNCLSLNRTSCQGFNFKAIKKRLSPEYIKDELSDAIH